MSSSGAPGRAATTGAAKILLRADGAALVDWLVDLLQQHGPGEYIVHVGRDGQVVVKRPRAPLRFECSERLRLSGDA